MSKREQMTPDWALMIEQLVHDGVSQAEVGFAMGYAGAGLTDRMVRYYRTGTQPPHWRGEGLIGLWCRTLKRARADVPQMTLIRGHRVDVNRSDAGPKLMQLPKWPPGELLKPKIGRKKVAA